MGDSSRDTLRGLLIGDPRLRDESAVWTAQSTGLTQEGRTLGRPYTTDTTSWRIEARGDSTEDLNVECIRGGIPGSGLGVAWKQSSEASTAYRGQDAPVAIRQSEMLALGVGGGSYESHAYPDTLAMQDGTIVVVNEFTNSTLGVTGQRRVVVRTIDSGTGTVTGPTTIATNIYSNHRPLPFVYSVPREDGGDRLMVGLWIEDSATGGPDAANLDIYYSDDTGATWAVYARSVLRGTTTIDALTTQRDGIDIAGSQGAGSTGWDLFRCRAAYANGQVLLMMHLRHHDTNYRRVADFLFQWQSPDLGASFTLVDEATSKTATEDVGYRGGVPTVRARDGLFHVAYVAISDSGYSAGGAASLISVGIQIDRLGSTAQRFTEVSSGDSTNPTLSEGGAVSQVGATVLYELDNPDCALALIPSGTLALYWRRPDDGTSGQEIRCALCTDGLAYSVWGSSMYSRNYGTVWDVDSGSVNPLDGGGATGNITNYPQQIAATGQGGRVVLATSWSMTGTTADASLSVLTLGGYHTQTMGSTTASAVGSIAAAVGWEQCWYGLHQPDQVGWTRTTAGTTAITFSTDGMNINTTGPTGSDYWTITPSGSGVEGVRLRWALICDSGNTGADYVAVRVIVRDGANTLDVSIRYNSTTVVVYDNHGATQLASVAVDMTVMQEFELAATVGSAGDFVLYHRAASMRDDVPWTTTYSGAPTLASNVAAQHTIRFGSIAAGGMDSTWRDFYVTTNNHTGLRALSDVAITNPDDLAPMALTGRWSEVVSGAFIRAVDGPAATGDAYTAPVVYGYGGERVLPSVLPSPSMGWRSTDETAQSLALVYNTTTLGTEESAPMGDTWGIHLAGINFGAATLEGYDVGTAAWVTVTALDFTTGVSYTRTGNVVELTSGSLTQQVNEGEWDGGWVDLGSSKYRRIQHTRGGLITTTGGTVRRPRLILEDVDGTEPASGSAEVYPRQATVIVRDADSYAGIRVSIDAQSTPDGYFEIGSVVVGPFLTFGADYSWGRVIGTEYNVDMNESRGGQRMPYKAGAPRRFVDFAWTDGIDVTQIDGSSTDADYMLSTSTGGIEPAAYNRAVLYDLEGSLSLVGGPLRPVVYVPVVGKGIPNTVTLTGRADAVYGRVVSPIRMESILGDENVDEVWRWSRFTLEEEV